MKEKSAFVDWFKAQFGGYPNTLKRQRLKEDKAKLKDALDRVTLELYEEEALHDWHNAALKAWMASRSDGQK